MQIEELMIGDRVQVFGQEFPSCIVGIDSNNSVQTNNYGCWGVEDIEPISLTPEILKKEWVYS